MPRIHNPSQKRTQAAAPALATFKKRDDWLRAVLADNTLSQGARNAAVRLGLYLNVDRERCDPSYHQLGKALGCTRRSAIRAVRELIDRDWVAIASHSAGRRNNFRLKWPSSGGDNPVTSDGDSRVTSDGDEDVTTRNASSDNSGAGWCQPCHRGGDSPVTERNSGSYSEENSEWRYISPPVDRDGEKKQSDDAISKSFAEFWTAYPRKVARAAAEKAYRRVSRDGLASEARLIAGARRYAAERLGQDQKFTKHPATWLNAGCWDDEPAHEAPIIDGKTGDIIDVPALRSHAKTWEGAAANVIAKEPDRE